MADRIGGLDARRPPGGRPRHPGAGQPRRRSVPARAEHGAHPVALQRHGRPLSPAGGAGPDQLPAGGERPRRLGQPVRPGNQRDLRPGRLGRDRWPSPMRAGVAAAWRSRCADAVADPERSPFSLRAHRGRAAAARQPRGASGDEHRARAAASCSITSSRPAAGSARLAHEARETGEERLANVGRFFEIVRRQGACCATIGCRSWSRSSTRSSRPGTTRRPPTSIPMQATPCTS